MNWLEDSIIIVNKIIVEKNGVETLQSVWYIRYIEQRIPRYSRWKNESGAQVYHNNQWLSMAELLITSAPATASKTAIKLNMSYSCCPLPTTSSMRCWVHILVIQITNSYNSSYVRCLPARQGTRVRPSCIFRSRRVRLTGSIAAGFGMQADKNALEIICWCRWRRDPEVSKLN